MFAIDGNPDATPRGQKRAAPPIARWLVAALAHDMLPPPVATGFGLLWATGDLHLVHAGREQAMRAGDLALVDRGLPLTLGGPARWTAQLLDLGDRGLAVRADVRGRCLGKALDGTDPLAELVKRLWTVGQEIDRMGLANEMIDARLIDLIGDLGGRLLAGGGAGTVSSHVAAMIERANLLIAAHLENPAFSAATLAARMRVTPRHLSSLFAATGTTATQAILAHRLAHAKSLLADPGHRHQQIASIARASGFDDQSYFARCFRRETGMTPRRFRDSATLQD